MPSPPAESAWPFAASLIASLAVAATIGLANVLYLLSVAGGSSIGGRLLAVLPIVFIATFVVAGALFWLLRWAVGRIAAAAGAGGLGTRGHGSVVLLTFLVAGLLHYAESAGMHRALLQRAGTPERPGGSCPAAMACTPLRSAAELQAGTAEARRAVAESGLLTAELFALLMRDADAAVRAALARRADLPAELLERLVGDRRAEVRAATAASLRLSDEDYSRLAFDRDERVRTVVAGNRNAPPSALEILASGSSAEIRLLVAGHPRAGAAALQRLLDQSGDRAEKLAQERLRGGRLR